MENSIPTFLLHPNPENKEISVAARKRRFSFIDGTLLRIASHLKTLYFQAEQSEKKNILSKQNPLVKVLAFLYLIVVISLTHSLWSQLIMGALIFIMYLATSLNMMSAYKKTIIFSLIFGLLIFAPAALNVISPGKIILSIITFDKAHQYWIYNIPQQIGLTEEGCKAVGLLFMRVFNSIALAMLITYNTHFPKLLKALRIIFIPHTFIMVISLAYKYIFILCKTVEDTYIALKSRLIGNISNKKIRELSSGRIYFIYKKSVDTFEQTYLAMVSRGYSGKVVLLDDNKLLTKDFIILTIVAGTGIAFLLL